MKARCEYCKGSGRNAMGVPCRTCSATGEIVLPDPKPATTSTKTDAIRGENGGFLVTRGKPRYAFFQGKHFVVGRGVAEEFPTVTDAYRRRDELLRS